MKETIMATQATTQAKVVSEQKVQEVVEISAAERAVGAAFIASGIGSTVLGLVIVLTELKAGAGLKAALTWVGPVGPLSGKTGVAVIAFVLSWVALHFAFKKWAISLTTAFIIAVVLIVLGLVLSFPPVFDLFAG
jgi:hypothetical protein